VVFFAISPPVRLKSICIRLHETVSQVVAPGYRYTDELAALIAPSVIALTRRTDVALGGYSDF
jgi:hypothetical protein